MNSLNMILLASWLLAGWSVKRVVEWIGGDQS